MVIVEFKLGFLIRKISDLLRIMLTTVDVMGVQDLLGRENVAKTSCASLATTVHCVYNLPNTVSFMIKITNR